jgi:hypothetical protein
MTFPDSPDRASDRTIVELYSDVAAAATLSNLLTGASRHLSATRAAIAATLRWAAEQYHPATETALQLRLWADQVDTTVPCPCGGVYRRDKAAEHFGAVAHEWAAIPEDLRGLPGGGRRAATLN